MSGKLSLRAAAAFLGVHPGTVRRWAESGRMPSRIEGGQLTFDPAELLAHASLRRQHGKGRTAINISVTPVARDMMDDMAPPGERSALIELGVRLLHTARSGRAREDTAKRLRALNSDSMSKNLKALIEALEEGNPEEPQ